MSSSEKFKKFLKEGEVIRWSGAPQPYSLFDASHKNASLISFCWALAWGIFLVGGYYWLSVSRGQEVKMGVMAFCAVVPIMIAWSPIGDRNNVKKLLYAITNTNIIVASESDKACIMPIADIDGLRSDKTQDGKCHIRMGSATFKAAARKLPGLAFRGEFDINDSNKTYKGLVFYNVSEADGKEACRLLGHSPA